MKRFFTISILILAMSFLVACSGNDEKEDLNGSTDTESGKSGDSSDTFTGDTGTDTGDTNADTGDTGADTGDTGADTGDTNADTGDTNADTGDTGADTGDTDTGDTDTGDTDTGDTDTGDTDTGDTDTGDTDTGDTDTGDTDTGDTDTGDTDTGDTDTGDTDTGDTDTGDTDTGDTDTGDTDTGDTDTGDTDTGDTDTSDTDTSSECIEITLSNTELSYYKHSHGSEKYDIFKATYTPNTGSATSDTFYLKFYGLSEYDYTGDYDLTESDKGLSLYVNEDEYCDSYSGDCTHGKTYFQKAGTVKVISAEFNFQVTKMILLSAKLNGVVLEETGNSEKRACLKIKNDPKVEYHDYYY